MTSPLDRSDAVNLARNFLAGEIVLSWTGENALAEAVLAMDEYIKELDPYGRGVCKTSEDF